MDVKCEMILLLFTLKCGTKKKRKVLPKIRITTTGNTLNTGKKDRLTRDRYVIDSPPQTANARRSLSLAKYNKKPLQRPHENKGGKQFCIYQSTCEQPLSTLLVYYDRLLNSSI